MINLDLATDTIAMVQEAARAADIAAARAFGFGGSRWWVDRPSGSGTQARTPVRQEGEVYALAFRQRPSQLAAAIAGQPVGAETWRVLVLDLAADVQPGDQLTSANPSGSYVIQIDSLEPWYDYRRGEVSEVRHG